MAVISRQGSELCGAEVEGLAAAAAETARPGQMYQRRQRLDCSRGRRDLSRCTEASSKRQSESVLSAENILVFGF